MAKNKVALFSTHGVLLKITWLMVHLFAVSMRVDVRSRMQSA